MLKSKMPVNINFLQAFNKGSKKFCRDDWIRTSGPHVPNVVRYRAALHPEFIRIAKIENNRTFTKLKSSAAKYIFFCTCFGKVPL
jgi:hypothetical protein